MTKLPNILAGESVEELNALTQSLYSQMEPANDLERRIVDQMVQHEWFMRRAIRMQQALEAAMSPDEVLDDKRLKMVARLYKTHERSYNMAKRSLEDMRKHHRQMEAMTARHEAMKARQPAEAKSRQKQWEQILKKMPPLTNWVN